MASSSSSWTPPAGKHSVNIGSSLGRAIKNKKLKGSPTPAPARRSNLPEKEFYSFKFNFKAASIDSTKPATLDLKKGTETTLITAEYPSKDAGQVFPFTGTELAAREVDCVLIYDEDTGQYTLEKVESFISFQSQRSKAFSPRAPIGSPAASTPASTSSFKGNDDFPVPSQREEDEEPEEGEEVEVEPPPPPPQRVVKPLPASRLSPRPPPPAPAPQPRAPPPPAVVSAPAPKKPSPPPPAPAAKPRPQPRPKKSKAAAAPPVPAPAAPTTSYPDEEVFDVVRPPTKRGRASPLPPVPTPASTSASTKPAVVPARKPPVPPPAPVVRPPVSLSLPGGSAVFEPPPPAVKVSAPAPVSLAAAAPAVASEPASPQMVASDSEDEDDEWEAVPTVAPSASMSISTSSSSHLPVTAAATTNSFMNLNPPPTFSDMTFEEIDGDALFGPGMDDDAGDADVDEHEGEGEEFDADALENDLNAVLGGEGDGDGEDSDEDFLSAVVAQEEPPRRGPIMSLNQYADAGGVVGNDSDYTSSDESD